MSTKINFSYDGKDYCLEYTRATGKSMENRGFVAGRIIDAPMTVLPDLFYGAFLANHKYIDRKVVDDIFDQMGDKKALVETLSKMYNEPLEAMMEDAPEGNGIAWTTT